MTALADMTRTRLRRLLAEVAYRRRWRQVVATDIGMSGSRGVDYIDIHTRRGRAISVQLSAEQLVVLSAMIEDSIDEMLPMLAACAMYDREDE